MHIKLINGKPESYTIEQLRRDNPQVSFPQDIPADTLAEYNVFHVTPTERPVPTENEVVDDAGYLQLADGSWEQAWSVRSITEQELEQIAQQKKERRKRDYEAEADPLFFKWQREEGTKEAWMAKISEIKRR